MESDLPLGKTTLIFGDPSKDLSLASEKLGAASKKRLNCVSFYSYLGDILTPSDQ